MTLRSTDADLVRSALAGHAESFEELVARYHGRASALVLAGGGRPDDVHDVVQDAFVACLHKLQSLRDPGSFGAWFLTIVRNQTRRLWRHTGREIATQELDRVAVSAPDTLESGEIDAEVWRAVSELPSGVREAVFSLLLRRRIRRRGRRAARDHCTGSEK